MDPITLFYSYSHRDEAFRQELEAHLSFLRRGNLIADWHDRKIGAGDEWKGEIDHYIGTADIVLLLVSADFINSDYCWGDEMTKALARHERGDARVIPVILRPCRWTSTPFGKLQAVPKDAKAISEWPSRDAAFDDIRSDRAHGRRVGAASTPSGGEGPEGSRTGAPATGWRGGSCRSRLRGPSQAERYSATATTAPRLVVIPAGEFMMGEGTQHNVAIARPFAVGKYPVTFDEWDACVKAEGTKYKPEDAGWGRGSLGVTSQETPRELPRLR